MPLLRCCALVTGCFIRYCILALIFSCYVLSNYVFETGFLCVAVTVLEVTV